MPPPTDRDPQPAEHLIAHQGALHALARALLGDEHAAEDVVQQSFVRALQHPPRDRTAVGAWLRRVTRNLALNRRRDELRRRSRESWVARPEAVRPSDVGLGHEEARSLVARAFARLHEPYRGALHQRYVEELTPAAIAAREGVSLNTVKARLRRGLAQMRETLDGEDHREGGWRVGLVALLDPAERVAPATLRSMMPWFAAAALVVSVGAFTMFDLASRPGSDRTVHAPTPSSELQGRAESFDRARPQLLASQRTPLAEPAVVGPVGELAPFEMAAFHFDGSPAADVAFSFCQSDYDDPRRVRIARTDENGHLVIGLPLGGTIVASDRGGRYGATVTRDQQDPVRVRLPRGIRVEGRVVDGHGRSRSGARVWLSCHRSDWLSGSIVATSSDDGRFELRGVDPDMTLCAFGDGFAQSDPVDLGTLDTSGGTASVLLRLDRPGAALTGRVLGPDGAPVAGARVAIGAFVGWSDLRADGSFIEYVGPQIVVSGERGEYRCDGLHPGEIQVCAIAPDAPLWAGMVNVAPGETGRLDLFLEPCARVRGRVLREDGSPVAGALVRVLDESRHGRFVDPFQAPQRFAFALPMAAAESDGSFVLDWLAPGLACVTAWDPATCEAALATFELVAGEEREWEARVALGPTIRGRVVDTTGEGIASNLMALPLDGDVPTRTAPSATDGTFAITGCRKVEYRILFDGRFDRSTGDELHRAWPDGDPVEIVVDRGSARDGAPLGYGAASVRGRLAAAGEAELTVGLMRDDEDRTVVHADDALDFRIAVAAGRYRLVARRFSDLAYLGPWFELAEGEERALGTIVVPEPSSIAIAVTSPGGTGGAGAPHQLEGWIAHPELWDQRRLAFEDGMLFAGGIMPGDYDLWIVGPGYAHVLRRIRLEPGVELFEEQVLEVGWSRTFEVHAPANGVWGEARIRVENEDGQRVVELAQPDAARLNPMLWTFRLRPGSYRVSAETDSGLRAETELEVEARSSGPLRLELR